MRAALNEALVGSSEAVASILRQAQADGLLSKHKDPDLLARFLINSWQGAVKPALPNGEEPRASR